MSLASMSAFKLYSVSESFATVVRARGASEDFLKEASKFSKLSKPSKGGRTDENVRERRL